MSERGNMIGETAYYMMPIVGGVGGLVLGGQTMANRVDPTETLHDSINHQIAGVHSQISELKATEHIMETHGGITKASIASINADIAHKEQRVNALVASRPNYNGAVDTAEILGGLFGAGAVLALAAYGLARGINRISGGSFKGKKVATAS